MKRQDLLKQFENGLRKQLTDMVGVEFPGADEQMMRQLMESMAATTTVAMPEMVDAADELLTDAELAYVVDQMTSPVALSAQTKMHDFHQRVMPGILAAAADNLPDFDLPDEPSW